ncbi:MAG: 3-deoxy-manno-octulosonate cytidylyltransferase [Myxococcales bacterium]|nr:3-deoxy-manno-octulosonate cytidylyltransferase [Myxococcales bacterium]
MPQAASFNVIIPSRFAASRLPGKPLRSIAGRSMIARVWDRAILAGANDVIVATDDARIVDEVESCGGNAMLTSTEHASGTDRLAEVVARLGWNDEIVVVNLQGDEPCIPVALITQVASALVDAPDAGIATMATPINSGEELFNDNAVKVVMDEQGMASYFSRAPIPWVRGVFRPGEVPETLPEGHTFLRHIGMYAYRAGVLTKMAAHPQSTNEKSESLEQLRAMAMGIGVHVGVITEPPPPGVDTQSDLDRARRFFSDEQVSE